MSYDASATQALSSWPTIIWCKRANQGWVDEIEKRATAIAYDDDCFHDFRYIDGRQTELICCTEGKTDTVFLVVKVILFKDMSAEQRERCWLFGYIERNRPYRSNITSNSVQVDGSMRDVGYRSGYKKNFHFGTYATKQLVKLRNNPIKLAAYRQHLREAKHLHRFLSQALYALSPRLHKDRVLHAVAPPTLNLRFAHRTGVSTTSLQCRQNN